MTFFQEAVHPMPIGMDNEDQCGKCPDIAHTDSDRIGSNVVYRFQRTVTRLRPEFLFEDTCNLRDIQKEITDNAETRNLENRRIGVFIDRNYNTRRLHPD